MTEASWRGALPPALPLFSKVNSRAKKSNPSRPKMSPTKTRSGANNGGDDASAEYSFTNDTTDKTTAATKRNKPKVDLSGVEGLTNALAKCDLGKKMKKELFQAVNDCIANGDIEGLQKFVLESGAVFITSVKYVQLRISASQELIPFMGVTESMRQSDNNTSTRRSLVFKIHILHPKDAKFYSLALDDKLATEYGYCVLKFTYPIISKAELAALSMLSKCMNLENDEYYGGLVGLDTDCLSTNNNIRKNKMEHALALCHQDDDVSKPVTLQTRFCKLPTLNGEQARTLASEWQGEKHDKKAQPGNVKFDVNFSVVKVEDEDGEVHADQVMWYLTAEIPLEGGEEKTLKSPGAKKLKSQKKKMAKLTGLIAGNSTTAAASSGTNAVGAVPNPTEEKEDEADEEKEDVDEGNVESVEGKADEEGGVVDGTAGEEDILIIEEEGDEAEATEGVDEDHQEYMDGLINEAKGSYPADVLNLTVNTAVTAVSSIASPLKIRQAASYILQSPTIQGMLPTFKGKSIEAEPSSEKPRRKTRNSKPSYN